MLAYQEIIQIIQESTKINTAHVVVRELETILSKNLLDRKPIKIISGIRRSGKSFILKRLYQKLLQENVPAKNIFFLNFENDLLKEYLTLPDLRSIFEQFQNQADLDKRIYIFLDEIQNINGWEKYIRTLYDSTDYEIFLTGSNSALLSSEFSTAIGGRVLEYKLKPLSLKEVMLYQNFNYEDAFFRQENAAKYFNICEQYINFGGFAETISLEEAEKNTYRNSILDKIIMTDILNRFGLTKPKFLRELYLYLERNVGTIISCSKIAKNAEISDKTVEKYLNYFQDSYLISKLSKLEWKTQKIFNTQQKIYLADNLFTWISLASMKLENAVYNELSLRYRAENIFFLRDEKGHEIDFVIRTDQGGYICIQVCWELNDQTAVREFRSLLNLTKYRKKTEIKKDRYLLICHQDDRKNKTVSEPLEILNIFDFLLKSSLNSTLGDA